MPNSVDHKKLQKIFQEASSQVKAAPKLEKAIYIKVLTELNLFLKVNYPDLDRFILKKLVQDLLNSHSTKNGKGETAQTEYQQKEIPVTRKRKTETLIVAAIELLIETGFEEDKAISKAQEILKKKSYTELNKLLKNYRSSLIPSHIRDLLFRLKYEGKSRALSFDSAVIYLTRASQNLK